MTSTPQSLSTPHHYQVMPETLQSRISKYILPTLEHIRSHRDEWNQAYKGCSIYNPEEEPVSFEVHLAYFLNGKISKEYDGYDDGIVKCAELLECDINQLRWMFIGAGAGNYPFWSKSWISPVDQIIQKIKEFTELPVKNCRLNLKNADLRNADLYGHDLTDAEAENANFTNATLRYANLSGVDLTNANFTNADLRFASLSYCHFKNTIFDNADLIGVKVDINSRIKECLPTNEQSINAIESSESPDKEAINTTKTSESSNNETINIKETSESSNNLPITSLHISNFQKFSKLNLPKFGRVNLLCGSNGSGKTTLLNAIRLYFSALHYSKIKMMSILYDILENQRQFITEKDIHNESITYLNYNSLFTNFKITPKENIHIALNNNNVVKISPYENGQLPKEVEDKLHFSFYMEDFNLLLVEYNNEPKYLLPWITSKTKETLYKHKKILKMAKYFNEEETKCVFVDSKKPSDSDLVKFVDDAWIENEDHLSEQVIVDAYGHQITGVASVSFDGKNNIVATKLKNSSTRQPLNALGDGVTRFFGIAAALFESRNGILLIDDVENSIHYSLHTKLWKMIIENAYKYNIQVFVSTNSFECTKEFKEVITEMKLKDSSVLHYNCNS